MTKEEIWEEEWAGIIDWMKSNSEEFKTKGGRVEYLLKHSILEKVKIQNKAPRLGKDEVLINCMDWKEGVLSFSYYGKKNIFELARAELEEAGVQFL